MIKESSESKPGQWEGKAGMSNIGANEKGITKYDSINPDRIQSCIYTIRGLQVMIDSDLAELYRIEVKALNQAVRRNIERFPVEFMFQLSDDEHNSLRSQIVTSNQRGGRRYLPYAFTEQGVAMLSAVLKSETVVKMSIQIISIKEFTKAHDRFSIIDDRDVYHFGASIKDVSKKWFCFLQNG